MSIAAWSLVFALGYPIVMYLINRFNDVSDERLRQAGFHVPRRRRQQGDVRQRHTKQPPHGTGLRGPIEGRFWGQFLP